MVENNLYQIIHQQEQQLQQHQEEQVLGNEHQQIDAEQLLNQQVNAEDAAQQMVQQMPVAAEIEHQAPGAQLEQNQTRGKKNISTGQRMTAHQKEELKRLKRELSAINKEERQQIKDLGNEQDKKIAKRRIQIENQAKRAAKWAEYAQRMPEGSQERARALEEKEKAKMAEADLKKLLAVSQIENESERTREKETILRHDLYHLIASIRHVFQRAGGKNPYSREECTLTIPGTEIVVKNKGRVFMGGTKPMYLFEDENGKEYLYKEAVNCIGGKNVRGALATEAGAKLQKLICGEEASIEAWAIEHDGEIVGSLQEKKQSVDQDENNLFKWQADQDRPLSENVTTQVLREHTLDWLLCNFDTKGENFLTLPSGNLCSFDKEASFRYLMDEGSQTMSYTYCPHANETIYNDIFRRFAEGKIDLNLDSVLHQILTVQNIPNDDYIEMFRPMLEEKYGAGTEDYETAKKKVLVRKTYLMEEYRIFFGKLVTERRTHAGHEHDYAAQVTAENQLFNFLR